MAEPTPVSPRKRRWKLFRRVTICLFFTLFLGACILILLWLVIKPTQVVYSVEEATVGAFAFSRTNTLNATFHFVLRLYNPNRRVVVSYQKLQVSALFYDEVIAVGEIGGFYQPRRNATRLSVSAKAVSRPVSEVVADDLRRQRRSGVVELDIRVNARLRFKVRGSMSGKFKLKAFCSEVSAHFDPSKLFKRRHCDVDMMS